MSTKIPSKALSLLQCRCPRCRKGKVFPNSAFNILGFSKTYDRCPVCDLKFEHETGFFWGAMYISYVFSAGLMLVFGVIAIQFDWSYTKIVAVLIPSILLITPFSYRYSRIVLLYFISPHRHFDERFTQN